MGFKLGRVLKKGVRSVLKRAPSIVTGFVSGGPVGAIAGGFGAGGGFPGILGRAFRPSGRPAAFMPREEFAGQLGDIEVGPAAGGMLQVQPAALPAVVAGLSTAVIRAITSIGLVLGLRVTALNITRVGMRAWRVVTGFARRHPGLSVITFLTSLGLAAEEAVEFLAWGEARSRRRRRRRGISAADMRVTRRTMRRMIRFHSDLRLIAGPGARRGGRRPAGAITAVSAGG